MPILLSDTFVVMDGKDALCDALCIGRRCQSVEHEEDDQRSCDSVSHVCQALDRCFVFYRRLRMHSALARSTPDKVYFASLPLSKAA